jgi:MFS family permease
LSAPDTEPLARLTEADWKRALAFTDRAQLTLMLGLHCRPHLPGAVQARIDRDLRNNAEHWQRVKAAYSEAASAFQAGGLEFVVLKGFSHCPRFVSDPRHRAQYDLDLLFCSGQALAARDIALRLGYEPIVPFDRHPIDHLPTMIRKTGWEWRGEPYDPDIPVSLELHFQLWDERTEGFGAVGIERFWDRRETRELDGLRFTAFHPADAVAYSVLHSLRHLLRGDPRPYHLYELAWLLHHSVEDAAFWSEWRELHDESLRSLEAIGFSLAERWFDCQLPAAPAEEIERLPAEVKRWLATYATSPLAGLFRPNKDELWLHWNLLDSRRARMAVLRRRLVPERLPGPVDAVHLEARQLTWRIRLRSRWRYLAFAASRLTHHARALPPTAWSAFRWFGAGVGLGAQFWRFLLAEAFSDFGLFVFVFLYNLYLLQLGFREDFVGWLAGVSTASSVAGTILAAIAIQRFGIRRTILTGFALTAGLSALRAYVLYVPAQVVLAALAGVTTSAWPVAFSPGVTQLTTEKNRPIGFSFICSSGIAIGILGGFSAGRLPGALLRLHWASSNAQAYREALLAGCAIVLLALWPFSRVKFGAPPPSTPRKFYRPSPLLARFLIAMAAWNLGTGALNPFLNVFFARRIHLPVEQIGYVFSSAQVAQVAAILLAPLVLQRFGLTRGIAGMQLATALAVLGLAAAIGPIGAAVAFTAFMTFQYMSEPGTFTLLMEGVPAGERSNASALNFLVAFGGQAIAAAVAGAMLARFGYPPVFTAAALICGAAALLFRILLARQKRAAPLDR